METPIKVVTMETSGFSRYRAFPENCVSNNVKAISQEKAIVECLVKAGLIEIIDLDAPVWDQANIPEPE